MKMYLWFFAEFLIIAFILTTCTGNNEKLFEEVKMEYRQKILDQIDSLDYQIYYLEAQSNYSDNPEGILSGIDKLKIFRENLSGNLMELEKVTTDRWNQLKSEIDVNLSDAQGEIGEQKYRYQPQTVIR